MAFDYGQALGLILIGVCLAYIVAGIAMMIAASRKRRPHKTRADYIKQVRKRNAARRKAYRRDF